MAMGELAEVVAARERKSQAKLEREWASAQAYAARQEVAGQALMPAIETALAAIGWKRLEEWAYAFETPEGVQLYLQPQVWLA
jgi:hypothetical protein